MKKKIALTLLVLLTTATVPPGLAFPFMHKEKPMQEILTVGTNGGTAEPDPSAQAAPGSNSANGGLLLKGQVTYVVPQGTPISLKLSTVPTTGLKLFDRDMDGNLLPAQLGQEITAKTTEDIFVAENKIIPEGTIFHGKVSHIFPPKRVGRPGSLALSFDYFKTPDGRVYAFKAEANNTRESTAKSKAKGLGVIAAHVAGGAAAGALIAYELFGLQDTIAMHGYNIAAGAAGGALVGVAVALLRKGSQAVLEPGDDLNMTIDTDMIMPLPAVKKEPDRDPKLAGFNLEVLKSKVVSDGLEGHMLRIDAIITNDSDKRLHSIDLFLEDDNGTRYPVASDNDEKSEYLFTIDPHTEQNIRINFEMEYPKLRRKLVWLDHQSRNVLIKERLP